MKATIKLEDGRTLDVEVNDEQLNQFEKQQPMTWEKLGKVLGFYVHTTSTISGEGVFNTEHRNRYIYPTKEHAEAALAEAQLLQLREWYRDGWKPTKHETRHFVLLYNGSFEVDEYVITGHQADIWTFQSKEVAERFLNEQRELLEVWAKKFSV